MSAWGKVDYQTLVVPTPYKLASALCRCKGKGKQRVIDQFVGKDV